MKAGWAIYPALAFAATTHWGVPMGKAIGVACWWFALCCVINFFHGAHDDASLTE